jgi:hypothetical protein
LTTPAAAVRLGVVSLLSFNPEFNMLTRPTILRAVALLVLALSATALLAADRTIWKHDKGTFSKAKGDRWIERGTDKDSKPFFFVEKARTPEYVEIYSEQRKLSIRLRDKVCMIQDDANKPYTKLYEGGWVDK